MHMPDSERVHTKIYFMIFIACINTFKINYVNINEIMEIVDNEEPRRKKYFFVTNYKQFIRGIRNLWSPCSSAISTIGKQNSVVFDS